MSITIKRARRTVRFCTDLSLLSEHDAASTALARAKQRASGSLKDSPDVQKHAKRIRLLEDQMEAATLSFVLEAMRNSDWEAFEETHPPREGRDDDKALTIDLSALDEAIAVSIREVRDSKGKAVAFDPAREWAGLAEDMANGQWEDFATALLQLNRGVKGAPFSQVASRAMTRSATD